MGTIYNLTSADRPCKVYWKEIIIIRIISTINKFIF